MGYFYGRMRGYANSYVWRSGPRYGRLETIAASPQGRVDVRLVQHNGVDWATVTTKPNLGDPIVLYDGPLAGEKANTLTHGRPVRDGRLAAAGQSFDMRRWDIGCGNCIYAPNGWGSGCTRPDKTSECGVYRWPYYGNLRHYPHWSPRILDAGPQ